VSLSAFLQLVRLAKIAAARVPDLTVPTLVLASRDDTVASFAATERLLAGREEVRLIACDRATTSSPAITTASSSPPRSSPS
jgi:alpha-beta hydrolase superfamily lysophospholipase